MVTRGLAADRLYRNRGVGSGVSDKHAALRPETDPETGTFVDFAAIHTVWARFANVPVS